MSKIGSRPGNFEFPVRIFYLFSKPISLPPLGLGSENYLNFLMIVPNCSLSVCFRPNLASARQSNQAVLLGLAEIALKVLNNHLVDPATNDRFSR